MFDVIRFLERNRISYVYSGNRNVEIACPFCGRADPSHHMSVAVSGGAWHCRRELSHKGLDPTWLVASLLKISTEQARTITGQASPLQNDFLRQVKSIFGDAPKAAPKKLPPLELLDEFLPIDDRALKRVTARPYINYLKSRGFDDIAATAREYNLRYCTSGLFSGRIILPIAIHSRLINWTARAISNDAKLRYRMLSTDPEDAERRGLPVAIDEAAIYNYDRLLTTRAETLYIVEGAFDVINVNRLARPYGAVATCLFTSAATEAQVALLQEVLPRFERAFFLLDAGTYPIMLKMQQRLKPFEVGIRELPPGVKDPGDLRNASFFSTCG